MSERDIPLSVGWAGQPPERPNERRRPSERAPGGGKRFGPYVIEAELGRGGMGAVYRARHAQTGVVYALKVILKSGRVEEDYSDRALARFRREAEVLARVDQHPGIVRIHSFGVERGTPYCVMEHVEGRSLAQVLKEDGPPSPERAAEIVIALAEALEHVHGHGVLHRDLKPANVLIDREGRPRLLDFGLAYDAFASTFTMTGEMLGTPVYMAPEQVSIKSKELDARTDVYGLGMILYELLAGRTPFEDRRGAALLAAIVREEPAPPSTYRPAVPDGLDSIARKAIEKEPRWRYNEVGALAIDLRAWRDGGRVTALQPTPLLTIRRRLATREARLGVSVMLVATVIGASAILLERGRRSSQERTRAQMAIERAYRELRTGDLEAVETLREEAGRFESAGGVWDGDARLEAIEHLARVAEGDSRSVAALFDDRTRWRSEADADAVARVLLASDQSMTLVRLAERAPWMLASEDVLLALAEVVVERDDVVAVVGPQLIATFESRSRSDPRLAFAARRISYRGLQLALDGEDRAGLEARCRSLIATLRQEEDPRAFVTDVDVERLGRRVSDGPPEIIEAFLHFLAPGDARRERTLIALADRLLRIVTEAQGRGPPSPVVWQITTMLFRFGALESGSALLAQIAVSVVESNRLEGDGPVSRDLERLARLVASDRGRGPDPELALTILSSRDVGEGLHPVLLCGLESALGRLWTEDRELRRGRGFELSLRSAGLGSLDECRRDLVVEARNAMDRQVARYRSPEPLVLLAESARSSDRPDAPEVIGDALAACRGRQHGLDARLASVLHRYVYRLLQGDRGLECVVAEELRWATRELETLAMSARPVLSSPRAVMTPEQALSATQKLVGDHARRHGR